MAHMQGRLGPMYAGGFHGWAQLIADGVEVRAEGGRGPRRRGPPHLPARARPWPCCRTCWSLLVIPVGPGEGAVGQAVDVGRLLRPRRHGRRRARLAHGRLGVGEQVLPPRRPAATPPSSSAYELPMLLAAASVAMAAGTFCLVGHPRRRSQLVVGCSGRIAGAIVLRRRAGRTAAAARSTCRSPTRRSSSAPTPSTPACASPCFLLAEYAGIVVLLRADHRPLPGRLARPWRRRRPGLWTLLKACRPRLRRRSGCGVTYPRLREDQLQKLAWTRAGPDLPRPDRLTGIVKVVIA